MYAAPNCCSLAARKTVVCRICPCSSGVGNVDILGWVGKLCLPQEQSDLLNRVCYRGNGQFDLQTFAFHSSSPGKLSSLVLVHLPRSCVLGAPWEARCRQSQFKVRLCPMEVGTKAWRSPGETWLSRAWRWQQSTAAAINIMSKQEDCKGMGLCPVSPDTHLTFHLSAQHARSDRTPTTGRHSWKCYLNSHRGTKTLLSPSSTTKV